MQIYTAESQVKNFSSVVRSMFHGMHGARYVSYRLFLKDVKAEYSKSTFGMLWDFVDPLVFAGIFYTLERMGFFNRGNIEMPYPVFIVYGFLLYQTFMESVTLPLDILKKSRGLLTHLSLAPECLLLSIFFRVLFNS